MVVKVGTFNLNNLFSRFNFTAAIDAPPNIENGGLQITLAEGDVRVRSFMGRLVKQKDPGDTATVARRITDAMNVDVLAVQEVEHIEILKQFNRDYLGDAYPYVVLVEGNDPRLIDVGVLSKLPIGPITSHQTATHPDDPGARVFGRDLLQVEIQNPNGGKLFTLYNTHMKSHFVPFGEDQVQGAQRANERRRRQAETTSRIVSRMERKGAAFILVGDMNDPPDSQFLEPMLEVDGEPLVNGLANAVETRPAKAETPGQGPGPQTPQWTHRFNPPGAAPPQYELFDQIWLSPSLAPRLNEAMIDRRHKHAGDGSDHDPAWVELDL